MPYDPPLFERGDTVYLRESAAVGFIEAHTISGVQRGRDTWVYTVTVRPNLPVHAPHYGERRSLVNGALITFEECEFIPICEALELAESYHINQLQIIQNRLASYCTTGTNPPTQFPPTGTSGTSGTSGP